MSNTTQEKLQLTIRGQSLSIPLVCDVARAADSVELITDANFSARMEAAAAVVETAVEDNQTIYGVTTGFGGMAGVPVDRQQAAASQNNLLSFLAAGAGEPIDRCHVRAAMLLRANVLAKGVSGVRGEVVERLLSFLKSDLTPVVRELGSIGASGDLVPLSTIGRAITGQSGRVKIESSGDVIDAAAALASLGLEPLQLLPKEGLAIVNGTSFSCAIAANCVDESRRLMALTMSVQSMMLQAMQVQEEPFEDFVHQHKPHPGQVWSAQMMRQLLKEGRTYTNGKPEHVQDRYSLRCFPQYMGPIVEGIDRVARTVETEMNAVSDNPLVDTKNDRFYQSGNFLGQYIGIAMDDLRRFIGLMAKHLDVQIATLVAPEFNNGLPASLRGNEERPYNMGLKGLQITGNSIMPMLTYYGHPIVEHFPTHAEQFNQNINGLSWGSANLAWKSVGPFQQYMAVSMMFAVQALDLRARSLLGHNDGRALLGTLVTSLYESICESLNCVPNESKPFLFNDSEQWLEEHLASLHENLCSHGSIVDAVEPVLASFDHAHFS